MNSTPVKFALIRLFKLSIPLFIRNNVSPLCVALLLPGLLIQLHGQEAAITLEPVITTVLGNYATGPFITVDHTKGNIYAAHNDSYCNCVVKVTPSGTVTTVAGTLGSGFQGDGGPATNAKLNNPQGVAVDSAGNLYIADSGNNRIREVFASTGVITTIAGNGTFGFYGDNDQPALQAELELPEGIAIDGTTGFLYFVDSGNERVRGLAPNTGTNGGWLIWTVAGTGTAGYNGDNIAATSAELDQPEGIRVGAQGNLYIADSGNNRIRKVTSSGVITTVSAGLHQPAGIGVDAAGNVYIADTYYSRVLEVNAVTGVTTTVAGSLNQPTDVVVDSFGNIYIEDAGILLKAGVPTSPTSFAATNVGSKSGALSLLLSVNSSLSISSVSMQKSKGGAQEFIIGNITGCTIDGITINTGGSLCTIPLTFQPAFPGLRQMPLVMQTSAGTFNFGIEGTGVGPLVAFTPGIIMNVAGNGTQGYSGDNGPATSAELYQPEGVAVDAAGNIYFADDDNNRVREVAAATGIITTVAGTGTAGNSGDGGPATSAELQYPHGVAVDASGNLYIADYANQRIRKVTSATGIITTVAGNGTQGYSGDNGPATSAELYQPEGVAVDAAGNIYFADDDNNRVREVAAATGIITTVAGTGTAGYSGDGGPATSAELQYPHGVAVDASGNLYIADYANQRIRKVTSATGIITTVAGNGTQGYSGDNGPATSAELYQPEGVAVDAAGNIYFADDDNNRVREVAAATGIITTVVGTGTAGYSGDGGPATSAELQYPHGVAVDASGDLYIADYANQRIRKVNVASTPALNFATTPLGMQSSDSPMSFALSNTGNSALTITAPSSGTNPSITSGFSYDASSTCPQLSTSSTAYSLVAGASCTYSVDFIPVAGGSDNGSLVLSDNNLNSSSTQSIALSGIGIGKITPTVTVTPTPTSITTAQALSVTVAISGGTGSPTATGSVTLSSSGYTSAATALVGGSVTINIPAGSLAVGSNTLTANYTGDSNYSSAPGTSSTVTVTKATPMVTATPTLTSITTAQALSLTVGVSGGSGTLTATGSVTLSSGTYTSTATILSSGSATINIPAGSLAVGSDTLTASYTPDSNSSSIYNSATGTSAAVTVTQAKSTPTVTVTPSASSITTVQALTVTVGVSGGSGNPTPSGSVTLSSGSYTSAATTLSSGSASINIPAGSLATGSDTLTASYAPDSNSSSTYNSATGISTQMMVTKATPTVTVTPASSSITTAQALSVSVTVGGTPTPTGSVTLTGGSYISAAATLSGGSATISIPAGSLTAGSDTLTASYSGDANYIADTGTTAVTVTVPPPPSFTVTGTAVTVSPGATTGNTSAVTVTPTAGFTGSVALTATITSSPAGAQYPPTLSFASTSPVSITGTTAGTATLTINTTAATSAALVYPKHHGVPWYATGGATLACILLFGIPARRRRWQTMLGMLALFVALSAGMLACGGSGGGGGGGGGGNPGTTTGTYTVTVTGTSGSTTATGTVTLTVQ